ncbi:porin [Pseudogemmobacter humi]|uniref:Porin n=1 Tax=Pseudogemmobacter humi TaxID=2483812 RepID=A0A3P5X7F2_9RHOB|nr:porin [Pseudogemmobacter humi]VDC23264.1 Porin [Pseudogemmobacter humi]
MKKLLIATTALVATGGMAAADVTISGYGRFGLEYIEDRNNDPLAEDTVISSRLRFNIDATTETDVGVTFGARLRVQYDDGDTYGDFNTAQFSVGYEGLTVSVGNVDTAFDSVALTYNSEMGYQDFSYGDADGGNTSNFFAYNSKGSISSVTPGYTGVAATYSISGVNLYFSYVDPDQYASSLPATVGEELGIAADWTNGQFSVAGSFVSNAAGVDGADLLFVGAAYNFGAGNVGLNYYDQDILSIVPGDSGSQVTLWGDYNFGATTVKAYISELDLDSGLNTDTAYGLGADYSLGEGARLSGSIQSGWGDAASGWTNTSTRADIGVRFDF